MPRNGSGQFVLPSTNPVVPDTIIATNWANPTMADIANALSTSISTDGQTPPTANLPMAGFRHTNVGPALAANQYARADQVQFWSFNIAANVTADATGTVYAANVPFGVGNAVAIPNLMPLLFVPVINNGGPSTLALNGGAAFPILNQNLTQLGIAQVKAGRPYALCFLAGNWILVTNTLDIDTLDLEYVRLAGSTMTGPLVLSQPPTDPLMAATKAYVDAAIVGGTAGVASFNTRVGAVVLLSGDVTGALGYTPFNQSGGTIGGSINVSGGVTGQGFLADRYKSNPDVNNTATGTINLLPVTGKTTFRLTMTGNVTITIEAGMLSGNVLRILFLATNAGTVTWPANVKWPLPIQTPPDLAAGPGKAAIVVLCYDGFSTYYGNVSVY